MLTDAAEGLGGDAQIGRDHLLRDPGRQLGIGLKKLKISFLGAQAKEGLDPALTDTSIETSIPGADDYSLLTIVECKDYSHRVPVDDIEEFHSKIQQIAGDNIKAIFITTFALQKAALSYAQSKKIAVIRFLPAKQVQWLIYHMTPDMMGNWICLNSTEFNSALVNQDHVGRNRSFYGCDELNIYGSLFSLLKESLIGSNIVNAIRIFAQRV